MSDVLVDLAVVSHRGGVRTANEDSAGFGSWVLTALEGDVLAVRVPLVSPFDVIVADGLGGHRGGERASRATVQSYLDSGLAPVEAALAANVAVHTLADAEPALAGMGSTLVAARLHPDGRVTIVNVGDSRAYRLVDGHLGLLSEDDRPTSGATTTVTQVIGGERRVAIEPHLFSTTLQPGGVLLLCSDGLHDYVDDDAIATALAAVPEIAARRLLDLALAAGAPDNVTIAVLAVTS